MAESTWKQDLSLAKPGEVVWTGDPTQEILDWNKAASTPGQTNKYSTIFSPQVVENQLSPAGQKYVEDFKAKNPNVIVSQQDLVDYAKSRGYVTPVTKWVASGGNFTPSVNAQAPAGYTIGAGGKLVPGQTTPTAPVSTEPSIDDLIKSYLSGLTSDLSGRETTQKQAIEASYANQVPKIMTQAAEGRRNLDAGGYAALKGRLLQEADVAKQNTLSNLAQQYAQLLQTGYGTALSGALNLKGLNQTQAYQQGQLGIQSGQLGLEQSKLTESQKQWQDQLKNMTEQLSLQKSEQEFNQKLPYLQRDWTIEDRPYYKQLAEDMANMNKPSDWDKFLGLVNAGANVFGGVGDLLTGFNSKKK